MEMNMNLNIKVLLKFWMEQKMNLFRKYERKNKIKSL